MVFSWVVSGPVVGRGWMPVVAAGPSGLGGLGTTVPRRRLVDLSSGYSALRRGGE
jgi:hypothetical protein